ncbi:MAG: ABC transporter permease [Burkholderiaceae bacterium]|nr:ABC transporter permease [Microbacteriaceae bacterium]
MSTQVKTQPQTITVKRSGRPLTTWGPPLLVLAGILAIWFVISALLGDRDFLLPPPNEVLTQAFFNPSTMGDILQSLGRTATVALTGLAVAIVIGVLWAVAMSQARWVERSLFPYAVVLQCIPILALVPLIGFWFGFDFFARTIVCVMIALFPMVSNTLFGLQSVDIGQRELFQLQKAGRWTVLVKLQFPAALPAIFAGMRISAGLAVVGAIVGDFFFRRGSPGIGSLIGNYQSRVQGAELFAAIITASLFGVLIFAIFGWIGKRAVGKWYDFGSS